MWNAVRTPLLTVLFIFICLFIFTKIFGPIPFSVSSVTTTKGTPFTVEGKGEVTAVPDTALVTLGVNKNASTVEVAKNQVNEIINKITQDLKQLGIDPKNIQTSNFSVNPDYDYTLGRQVAKGYTVDATVTVKITPIEKANQAIDIATKDGATQVGGVQFVLNEQTQKKLENQARKEAIANAKEKANSLADAAGIRLGRIVDVQENQGFSPRPMMLKANGAEAVDSAPTTELNPGENKVAVTITLSYETY